MYTKNPRQYASGSLFVYTDVLDQSCFLECGEGPVLLDGSKALGRDGHGDRLLQLRYKDGFLLEVYLASAFSGRVKFPRADAI